MIAASCTANAALVSSLTFNSHFPSSTCFCTIELTTPLYHTYTQTGVPTFAAKQLRSSRTTRGQQRCLAMATEEDSKLSFESNKRAVRIP